MADNVIIPATGNGGTVNPTIATDDIGGTHFQRVKLVDGTLDSSAVIPGTSANGLLTDVSRIQTTVDIAFGDANQLDAFGRLRTSTPVTLFESKQIVDNQPLWWDDVATSGTGTSSTYNTGQASTTLAVSNATAGTRVRQTKVRVNYQPGKSQQIMVTFLMGPTTAGLTKRIGIFDQNDGIFLESAAGTLNFVLRSSTGGSPSDTNKVAQAAWNIDKFNGSGPSGITLDLTKVQLLFIDFAWLGTSRVRLGFVVNGILYYAHEFFSANIISTVYMSNPNLPIRAEISNSGAGSASSLIIMCAMIASEGGNPAPGTYRAIDRGVAGMTTLANTNIFPVVAISLKPAYLMASITNVHINLLCLTNANFRWVAILNPVVTGTAFNFVSLANSAIQYDTTCSNATTLSGGTIITSGYESSTTSIKAPVSERLTDFQLGSTIAGVSDVIAVGVQTLIGTTETFFGGIHFSEAI
jgi:hypothetical protein